MPVLVPVASEKQQFTVQLGSWWLQFDVYFNDRSQLWMFDLTDALTGNPLVLGQPFVLGQDFIEPYIWGIGMIFAIDTMQQHQEAGPADLGARVVISYLTPQEQIALHTP